MLQAANTDLLKPLTPKVYKSEYLNILFCLETKPLKATYGKFADFYFLHPCLGTIGLRWLWLWLQISLNDCQDKEGKVGDKRQIKQNACLVKKLV